MGPSYQGFPKILAFEKEMGFGKKDKDLTLGPKNELYDSHPVEYLKSERY